MSDREQKNEKRESLADIVSEMRNLGKLDEKSTDKITRRLMGLGLRTYADRIEAARKREREPVTERHAVGNAAAMREALEAILKEANTQYWNDNGIDLTWLMEKAKAALSAPARNCDLPLVVDGPANNNADKAWLVFKRHNPDAYFDVSGLLRCIDWLLAPAAERKGETK